MMLLPIPCPASVTPAGTENEPSTVQAPIQTVWPLCARRSSLSSPVALQMGLGPPPPVPDTLELASAVVASLPPLPPWPTPAVSPAPPQAQRAQTRIDPPKKVIL